MLTLEIMRRYTLYDENRCYFDIRKKLFSRLCDNDVRIAKYRLKDKKRC